MWFGAMFWASSRRLPHGSFNNLPYGKLCGILLGFPVLIGGLPMSSAKQTRSDLIEVAKRHFSERGYQGTSLAQVSAELGVTKQALLHHFKSKDLLYRAVLDQLTQDLVQLLFAAMEEAEEAERQLEKFFVSLSAHFQAHRSASALLIGGLIDAPGQAAVGGNDRPPLQDFLEPLVALFQATARWQGAGFPAALCAAIEVLGATCLLPAARGNLSHRFGCEPLEQAGYFAPAQTSDLVRAVVHTKDLG